MPPMDPSSPLDTALAEPAAALPRARSVLVLSGAGASAESGVPTFRDALTGLWARYDPAQLATPEAFARDPETVTRWYDWRRLRSLECRPNPGHSALARIERTLAAQGTEFLLATQNVDRLHHRAGSERVVELHGTLHVWRDAETAEHHEPPTGAFDDFPPRSPRGGILRPCVVWFGEVLPEAALTAAWHAASRCDLFLSVGTSAIVYPAAGLIEIAASAGARILEINPEPTPLTDLATWSVRASSGEALPILAAQAFDGA